MFNKLKSLFKKPVESSSLSSEVEATVEIVEKSSIKPPSKPIKPRATSKSRKRKTKSKAEKVQLSPKEKATADGEPWVNIIRIDLDANNINSGAFTLDWNDKFILNLIRAGYKIREDDTESDIVDRWFQITCRNVALEVYEQANADPAKRTDSDLRQIQSRDLGDGRSEIS